jgi:hypothetical protein
MLDAGYSAKQAAEIKAEVLHYDSVRQAVKLASGDYVDLKQYEPDMRHLLDRYLQAEESRTLHDFNETTLVQLLVAKGPKATEHLPKSITSSEDAVAETIENNVRKVIVDEMSSNPKYFASMSELLDAILEERRTMAIEYREFLEKVAALATQIASGMGHGSYPEQVVSGPQRAFFDNLDQDAELAVSVDAAIRSCKEGAACHCPGPRPRGGPRPRHRDPRDREAPGCLLTPGTSTWTASGWKWSGRRSRTSTWPCIRPTAVSESRCHAISTTRRQGLRSRLGSRGSEASRPR